MPELPDITVYIEALEQRLIGATLQSTCLSHPFLLRSFEPPLTALNRRQVERLRRIGKRIAIRFEGDLWLVMHLMIAGRLHWFEAGAKRTGRAAHPLRRKRDELLPTLPDRRPAVRGPRAVAPSEVGLAAYGRGAGIRQALSDRCSRHRVVNVRGSRQAGRLAPHGLFRAQCLSQYRGAL